MKKFKQVILSTNFLVGMFFFLNANETQGQITICSGQSTTLCGQNFGQNRQWRLNGGPVFSTSQCVTVSQPGSYCLNTSNFGQTCWTVNVSIPEPPIISCFAPNPVLENDEITLTVNSGNSFLWSNGASSQSITVPNSGGYTVQVFDQFGCSATSQPVQVFSNSGCNDIDACNYNSSADCNDGSCIYPGCTNIDACNYDQLAGCDDGSCLFVSGCMDESACNYNPLAQCDNNQCVYPGCMNPQAANFNSTAGCDDGSCLFEVTFKVDMTYVSGFSTPYVAGTFNGWCGWCNPMSDINSNGIWETSINIPSGYYEFKFEFDNWSGQENILPNQNSDPTASYLISIDLLSLNGNWGGDVDDVFSSADPYFTINNAQGTVLYTSEIFQNQTVATYEMFNFVLSNPPYTITIWDADDITQDDNLGTTNLNVQQGSTAFDIGNGTSGTISFNPSSGCTVTNSGFTSRVLNVNSATILPVVCWGFCSECSEVIGCTDSLACNYDSTAGINDGTCNYGGCLNDLACNYDPTSMCDNGSCIFPGCNNPIACNFNALAGCDDGSCILPGCTDINACNYNSETTCDDGSCVYPGCTEATSCNFDPNAGCDDGSCIVNYMSCNDNNSATVFDSWYNPVDFGIPFQTCICTGPQLLFGTINSDEIVLCPNQDVYSLTVNLLPQLSYDPINPFDLNGPTPIEIDTDSYNLQWYFKTGNNAAPTGSNTSGWNIIPSATSATLTVDAFVGTRTYACFVTPDVSYGISGNWMSGAKVLTYSSFAAQTIIGNPNITPFNAYNYIVNPVPGHTYNWTVVNGAIASGQGTNNVSIMWGQNGPYQLTLTESDGTCTGSSYLFAVNNNCSISVSAASASTNNTFCAGTTLQLQAATAATGITYQWYLNGTLIPNETNQNISVSSGGNYQVSINQNGCTAVSNIVSITELTSAIIPSILVEQANAGCAGGDATLTVSGGNYTNLVWNNGLTANSIIVNTSGDYSITAIDENGCAVSAGPVAVNFSILEPVPVCIVTVDQVTGKNNVVWEPVTSNLINSYVVLKETNVANEYTQIGTVTYGSNGIFEDVNSNPQVQANRYKLALIDTCGILSSGSSFHKTIHLAINQGLGNNVNLIWSDYQGFDFGSYSIYRGTSPNTLNLLTTIASNLNSYTDVNPPAGETYYMIEVAGVSCDPSRSVVYSHSNIIDSMVGIDDIELASSSIFLYPNPAKTNIVLQVNTPLIGQDYVIFDAIGKVIYKNKIQSTNEIIHLENFNNGNYFVKVNEVVKRFVVQH